MVSVYLFSYYFNSYLITASLKKGAALALPSDQLCSKKVLGSSPRPREV